MNEMTNISDQNKGKHPIGTPLALLPNAITILRVILTLIFIIILTDGLLGNHLKLPAGLYIIFAFICLSDYVDGVIARVLKAESALGGILDVLADSTFIFSSLVVFIVFGVLPLWYGAVVFIDFFVFLSTSWILARTKIKSIRSFFVFDIVGRLAAGIFYFIPLAACLVYNHPGLNNVFIVLLYGSALLAAISMTGRCILCFMVPENGPPGRSQSFL